MAKNIIFIILFLALCFLALRSLGGPQFYTSHDGQSHLARLYELDKVLKDGQFPPRWAGDFAGQRGYPVFTFAYPLPYWLAELFYLLGFGLAGSLKLVFALFFVLSGIFTYIFAKAIFRSAWSGLVAAILVTWAPYRFVKIYVTASLGESIAFAFVPLVLLFIYRRSFLGLTLSLAALVLVHPISAIMFLPLFAAFAFINKKIKLLFFAGLLGIGLSAFYLLPATREAGFTRYREILTGQYFKQFVPLSRLLYSRWGWGVPGEADPLSQQVGIAGWLALLAGTLVLIKKPNTLLFVLVINFWLAIFLMLSVSRPFWDFIPGLKSVDTPWRFLSVSVVTSSLTAGWLLSRLRSRKLLILSSLFICLLAIVANRNHLRTNAPVDWDENYFANYYWVGSGWDEYRPIWIKDSYHKPPKQPVETGCEIGNYVKKSNLISFHANCQKPSQVLVHHAYWPGWQAKANQSDKTDEIKANLEKSQGLMLFSLPQGDGEVKFEFKETPFRKAANTISIVSLVFLVVIWRRKKLVF